MEAENHERAAQTLRALAPGLTWSRAPEAGIHADEVSVTLSIAALTQLCAGHFPGAPVVPGAHLLGCLLDLAQQVDALAVVVERCVFRAQVRPDAPVVLAVWPAASGATGRVFGEVRVPGEPRPAALVTFVRAS